MKKNQAIERVIGSKECVELSILPTRLHRMERLSEILGANLYCKRDDLTGFAFGGNKTRKLDYLMKEALDYGADSIVTFGSNQSNWCRMASAAARALGMDVYLLLDGAKPADPTANLVLDYLVGANIDYLECSDPEAIIELARKKVDDLLSKGLKPFYLPVGGSTPVGTLGYIRTFQEIMDFTDSTGTGFDTIFVATGSAGTQAGLVCGKIISKWQGNIIGVSVGREKNEQEEMISILVDETLTMLGIPCDKDEIANAVKVDEDYFGEGYRINTLEAGEAIRTFARYEGIFLDEVYTGKAASALIDYSTKGRFEANQNILFIHTGGGIQLFE